MRVLAFQLLIFILISIAQPAIISNCIRQFLAAEPAKNFCLECWHGFYVKQGSCQQCNKYVKNMECSYPKYINSHSTVPSNSISNNIMSLPNNNTQSKQVTKPVSITGNKTTQIVNRNDTNGSKVEIKNLPSELKIINVIINDNDSKNNNVINRCVVYSEIENKCILCDAGYVLVQSICTINHNITHNKTTNLAILDVLQKSKQLLQAKNQNASKLIVSSYISQISNITEDYHRVMSLFDYGHQIMVNVTNESSNQSARADKKVEFGINKTDWQVKIQKTENNDTYIIKNNSERCAEYREQKGKQKICMRCIEGYIINRLQNQCVGYHKFMEVATDNSQIIMKKLSNNNKVQRKLNAKKINQSTIQDNNDNGSNTTYDYNATSIDVKIMGPALTHIPTFSVAEHQSIHIVLPSANSSNRSVEQANISDNSSNVHNITNVINITAVKMKYNLTKIIDMKTNKTMMVLGTTTNPPNRIDKCIKYREITYTCVQCEIGFTLAYNKCTDNISISSASTNTSTDTKI